jgi:hypothetical protein
MDNNPQSENHYCMAIAISTLSYGSEHWMLKNEHIRKIETAEMCFLREVTGYRITDHCYESIRKEQGNQVGHINSTQQLT